MMEFDMYELYAIYGRKSVPNALKEYIEGTANSVALPLKGIKSKARAYYDEPKRVPSTFFVELYTSIALDLKAIAEDFNDLPPESSKPSYNTPWGMEPEKPQKDIIKNMPINIPSDDDDDEPLSEQEVATADTNTLAKQAMASQPSKGRVRKVIDLHAFFMEVFRKKASTYAVWNKVRELQRAGVFSEALGDFTIDNVAPTKYDDFTWYSFSRAAQAKNSILNTGYSFDIVSKTKVPASQEEILKIAQDIVPLIEKNIFVDTKYYKFFAPGKPKPIFKPEPEEPETTEEPSKMKEAGNDVLKEKTLTVPEKHQLDIAYKTLKMNPTMANVMGGPSPEEARRIIKKLTGKDVK